MSNGRTIYQVVADEKIKAKQGETWEEYSAWLETVLNNCLGYLHEHMRETSTRLAKEEFDRVNK